MIFLLFSGFALFSFPAQAGPAEDGVVWETLIPTLVSQVGPVNVTMRLRGFVQDMGPGPGNESRLFGFCITDSLIVCFDPLAVIPIADTQVLVTGPNNQTPPQPLVTFDVSLAPNDTFRVGFVANATGGNFLFLPPPNGVIIFTTPGIQPFVEVPASEHPIGGQLIALGLPPDIGLFMIGVIMLFVPMGLIMLVGQGDEKDLLSVLVMGSTVNVFLRFWPAIIGIFLWLFVGWVLVGRLSGTPGGGLPGPS